MGLGSPVDAFHVFWVAACADFQRRYLRSASVALHSAERLASLLRRHCPTRSWPPQNFWISARQDDRTPARSLPPPPCAGADGMAAGLLGTPHSFTVQSIPAVATNRPSYEKATK